MNVNMNNTESVVSPWAESHQQNQHPAGDTDGILSDRLHSPREEQNMVQNLKSQIESFESEEKQIGDNRCRMQKQIHQMEVRCDELSVALDNERAELQREEQKYSELETDAAGFEETFRLIKSRREAIEKAKQEKRDELMQLQKIVEEIREETRKSEKMQTDLIAEVENRKRELENERNAFASAIKKANLKICRLRETIDQLKECNKKEAAVRASTLAAAKQAVDTGKHKHRVLLANNSREESSNPKTQLKTVYWSPCPKKKGRTKKSTRPVHRVERQQKAGTSEFGLLIDQAAASEPSTVMEVHTTPPQPRSSRRASYADLRSKVDSLSRLGEADLVNKHKLSSAEKWKDYGETDSFAVSSEEKSTHKPSPQSLTYMGHEILRKKRRHSSSARLDR